MRFSDIFVLFSHCRLYRGLEESIYAVWLERLNGIPPLFLRLTQSSWTKLQRNLPTTATLQFTSRYNHVVWNFTCYVLQCPFLQTFWVISFWGNCHFSIRQGRVNPCASRIMFFFNFFFLIFLSSVLINLEISFKILLLWTCALTWL